MYLYEQLLRLRYSTCLPLCEDRIRITGSDKHLSLFLSSKIVTLLSKIFLENSAFIPRIPGYLICIPQNSNLWDTYHYRRMFIITYSKNSKII